MSTVENSAFSPLVTLVRRWKLVALTTVLGIAVASVYGVFAKKWYEARLAVVSTTASSDTGSALMSVTKDLPEKLGISVGVSSDAERIATVFQSSSVLDEVIEKFKLTERYGESSLESTRAALRKHCVTTVDRKSDLVILNCEDTDPQTAKALAEFFGDASARVLRRISASSARDERRFLEARVGEARQAVDDASRKLREFREKHKIVDLEQQSKAVVSAMGSLEGDLLSKQLKLSYLDDFSSSNESSVVQLRAQITALRSELKALQEGREQRKSSQPEETGFFPSMSAVPQLAFEFQQLYREEQIQERVFFLLTMQHEVAKVKEARDTASFQVLDSPTIPTQKIRPQRRMIIMLGAFAGAALGAIWVLLLGWWRSVNRVPAAP